MTAEEFIKLSQEGEGAIMEYKSCTEKISESLYETICSFLNHSGGKILVGVKDNGTIIGVNPNKADMLIANIITTPETKENVTRNTNMSLKTPTDIGQMSPEKSFELDEEDFRISLNHTQTTKNTMSKKHKRQQGIIGFIKKNPRITVEEMAEKLDVNERTIHRDIEELKNIIEHIGPTKSGYWTIKDHNKQ